MNIRVPDYKRVIRNWWLGMYGATKYHCMGGTGWTRHLPTLNAVEVIILNGICHNPTSLLVLPTRTKCTGT